MQIFSGVETVLDAKKLVGVVAGARLSLLRAVSALPSEVVALTRIMTSARDRNKVVKGPNYRRPWRQRSKETGQVQPSCHPVKVCHLGQSTESLNGRFTHPTGTGHKSTFSLATTAPT